MIKLGKNLKVLLVNRDYETILNRNDLDKMSDDYKIRERCICQFYKQTYKKGCINCPFNQFREDGTVGCLVFIKKEDLIIDKLYLGLDKIGFMCTLNSNGIYEGRKQIQAIRNYLLEYAEEMPE